MCRFSLIVCTVTRTAELEAFLGSLAAQKQPPAFEVIVVDQNPDDRLAPLLDRCRGRFPVRRLRSAPLRRRRSAVRRNPRRRLRHCLRFRRGKRFPASVIGASSPTRLPPRIRGSPPLFSRPVARRTRQALRQRHGTCVAQAPLSGMACDVLRIASARPRRSISAEAQSLPQPLPSRNGPRPSPRLFSRAALTSRPETEQAVFSDQT